MANHQKKQFLDLLSSCSPTLPFVCFRLETIARIKQRNQGLGCRVFCRTGNAKRRCRHGDRRTRRRKRRGCLLATMVYTVHYLPSEENPRNRRRLGAYTRCFLGVGMEEVSMVGWEWEDRTASRANNKKQLPRTIRPNRSSIEPFSFLVVPFFSVFDLLICMASAQDSILSLAMRCHAMLLFSIVSVQSGNVDPDPGCRRVDRDLRRHRTEDNQSRAPPTVLF